ncbi:MAG: hypothetical protein EBY16_01235 [Gammaproteobacteria bacterium]|nr:hypothetical protein [Gammaproteobacteria bacterium]
MSLSQIISGLLLVLIMKWSVWHLQLLTREHQEIMRVMHTWSFKMDVLHDFQQIFLTFSHLPLAYDAHGISLNGIALVDIDAHGWRFFYIKKDVLMGERIHPKQIRLHRCADFETDQVLIFTKEKIQKNTILHCEDKILSLKMPLDMDQQEVHVTPIDYKTYLFRLKDGIYHVFLKHHHDTQHLLNITHQPQLSLNNEHDFQLHIGAKIWHLLKSKDTQASSV